MDLERGVLARIDRKLLAGLGQDETYRMVRVPVTASKWSTWKRYCESAGVSMGRAIVTLIDRELVSVFGDSIRDGSLVFAEQAEEEAPAPVVGRVIPDESDLGGDRSFELPVAVTRPINICSPHAAGDQAREKTST